MIRTRNLLFIKKSWSTKARKFREKLWSGSMPSLLSRAESLFVPDWGQCAYRARQPVSQNAAEVSISGSGNFARRRKWWEPVVFVATASRKPSERNSEIVFHRRRMPVSTLESRLKLFRDHPRPLSPCSRENVCTFCLSFSFLLFNFSLFGFSSAGWWHVSSWENGFRSIQDFLLYHLI